METKYTTLFKRISRTTTTDSTTTTFKFVSAIPIDEYLNEYKEIVRKNTTTMNKKIKNGVGRVSVNFLLYLGLHWFRKCSLFY